MLHRVRGADLGGPIGQDSGFWLYVRPAPGAKDAIDLEVGESTAYQDRPGEGAGRYTVTRVDDG